MPTFEKSMAVQNRPKGDSTAKGSSEPDFTSEIAMPDSNQSVVQRIANKYGIGSVMKSTRKDKKYMVLNPSGKYVHFGAKGYEDYTVHKDPIRLANFQRRNAKWKTAPKWSPAWLSYHLLW